MNLRVSVFIATILFASVAVNADESNIKITPSGFAYYQIGQIEKQTPEDALLKKAFDQHFNGRFTLEAEINQHLRVIVGAEAELGANLNDNGQKKTFFLKEAQGIYSFGDPSFLAMQIASGYFPFKYNPEARNLGEYLYRTGTYPGYVVSDFDNPKARLMGFRVSGTFMENIKLDALFTSEYTVHPYYDYSLSFVGGYKPPINNIIDIGAGIDFDRILPIMPERTTNPTNVVRDTANNPVIENGDTLKFTFKGTKLMGRVTFDFKPLLPFAEIFGPDDGKIYGEIAVLGLKNYGATYDAISKRIPIMFGFNIPCFNYVDVISFETEYYGSDTTQSLDIPTSDNPVPDMWTFGKRTPWKWSFFAQKTIVKGWAIKGLIGRDHYRSVNAGGNYDEKERMNSPGDWHYKLRIMYSF
jgi:hypothetical protein